jgi:hypothetical protein
MRGYTLLHVVDSLKSDLSLSRPLVFGQNTVLDILTTHAERHLQAGYGVLSNLEISANNGLIFGKPTKPNVGN